MAEKLTRKQLGQATPADTSAVSIYSPASGVVDTTIDALFVANTSSGNKTFRVFLDDDGTTYDTTTALFYDVAVVANATNNILSGASPLYMNNSSGNLAVRSSSANDLTFTVFGVERTGNL